MPDKREELANASWQVLRYSALALGVFYGFYHQRSLNSSQKAAAAKREYEHKQALIEQAKAEYTKSKQPPAPSTSSGGRKSAIFLSNNFDTGSFVSFYHG